MPSLERTAYPRFARVITAQELERAYTPSQEELTWARGTVRTPNHLLCLGILLKSFQRLHYFPDLDAVPEVVVNHIRQCFQLDPATQVAYQRSNTIYRHQQLIREWLEIEPYYGNARARRLAARAALRASEILDDPVDIVNATIDELQRKRIELPAYSTLDRFADRAHAAADRRLFGSISRRLSREQRDVLNELLTVDFDQRLSAFQILKTSAKKATLSHLEELVSHVRWLDSLGDMEDILATVPPAKRRSFAREAKALDAAATRAVLRFHLVAARKRIILGQRK